MLFTAARAYIYCSKYMRTQSVYVSPEHESVSVSRWNYKCESLLSKTGISTQCYVQELWVERQHKVSAWPWCGGGTVIMKNVVITKFLNIYVIFSHF